MMRQLTLPEQLLRNVGVEEPKEIDLEAIAWTLGVRVKFKSLPSCEARIVGDSDRAIITVDTSKTPQRRRYSIAHELGHWYHHRGRCLICRSEDIGNVTKSATDPERIADDYASDLMLPRYILEPMISGIAKLTLKSARQIAEQFNASLTATLLKIVETDRYPIVLVCHTQNGRRWFRRSKGIPERWFPRAELHHESSSFPLLFGKAQEEVNPRRVKASLWFDQRDATQFDVLEQAFALPNNQICSILTLPDPRMLVG
jgi:Zn-dependent peptidase ImmA (M78 family)